MAWAHYFCFLFFPTFFSYHGRLKQKQKKTGRMAFHSFTPWIIISVVLLCVKICTLFLPFSCRAAFRRFQMADFLHRWLARNCSYKCTKDSGAIMTRSKCFKKARRSALVNLNMWSLVHKVSIRPTLQQWGFTEWDEKPQASQLPHWHTGGTGGETTQPSRRNVRKSERIFAA